MINCEDGITVILAARHYLYTLLQHLFGHEPTAELLENTVSEHTKEALVLFFDEEDSEFSICLDLLSDLKQSLDDNPENTVERLRGEYTRLMVGPGRLPAPPWESVYLAKARIIFQESTLKVRDAYREYQLLPQNYPHEADDHIALELDFMASLARFSLEESEKGEIGSAIKILSDHRTFLKEHPLVWIGKFAEQIQHSETHYLYPQIACLTDKFLKADAEVLDEMIAILCEK